MSLIHFQAAAAATVIGHIEPKGTVETGKRATLVLDISTSPILGNEFVDSAVKLTITEPWHGGGATIALVVGVLALQILRLVRTSLPKDL